MSSVIKKTVDDNSIVTIYPIDNIKLEFKAENIYSETTNIIWRKKFMDENCRWWGEYIYYIDGQIIIKGFYTNDFKIGMWTYYNRDGSLDEILFFSFENPGKEIDENEYKRQLAKIRLGLLKVPALDLKISDYEC